MPPSFLVALLAAWTAIPAAHAGAEPALGLEEGRCVGSGKPEKPPSGRVLFDLRHDSRPRKESKDWELLGFKVDEKSGHLISRNDEPVSKEFVAWMYEPEDFSRERVPAYLWANLVGNGLRLDEAACVMRDASGKAFTRFDYRVMRAGDHLYRQLDALEYLRTRMKGLDPSAPVPPELIEDMEKLSNAGTALPPDIAAILNDDEMRLGTLAAGVDFAYAQSTRFFDGQNSMKDLRRAAMPAVEGNLPPKKPTYVEPAERRLGKVLSSELEKRFSGTEAGLELLDHFRDRKGRVQFPPILLLKTNQRPGDHGEPAAFFDPAMGAMVLNHWEAARFLAARVPPEQRPAFVKGFSNSRALSLYLETNPRERAALLDNLDVDFYHEFIHAWQDRRGRLNVEMLRGNAPPVNPLVQEYEAHREECRYVLEKSVSEPMALESSGDLGHCLEMLKSYESFREGIRRQYLDSFAGSQDLPDVIKRQEERESMARRLMKEGYRRVAQALKLAGMRRGDEALKEVQSDHARREEKFVKESLPELRRLAADTLPDRYMKVRRPDLALQVIRNLLPSTTGLRARRDRICAQSAPLLISPPEGLSLQERVAAFSAFPQPWPVALWPSYWRDAAAQASFLKEQAEAEKNPSERRQLLQAAKDWSKEVRVGRAQKEALKLVAAGIKDSKLRSQYLDYAAELSSPMHGPGLWGNKF